MRPSSITGNLAARLLSALFPPVCLACRQVEGYLALDLGLCSKCRAALQPLGANPCLACGRPMVSSRTPAGYVCGNCRLRPPPFERLLAVWSYEPPFDRVIHAFKFGRLVYLGDHLARHLAEQFGSQLSECDLVVPLPLHWSRQLRRGYNQAEEIARPLSRRLGLPLVRAVRRWRPTAPQTRLDRRRRAANLRGAFGVASRRRLRGRAIILVDDVVTTGATLAAATVCLQQAGARQVVAVAAGRTPLAGRPELQHR